MADARSIVQLSAVRFRMRASSSRLSCFEHVALNCASDDAFTPRGPAKRRFEADVRPRFLLPHGQEAALF